MRQLTLKAFGLVTIMILSTMTGLVYDDITNDEGFVLEYLAHATNSDEEELSQLFSDFDCQFEAIESCEILHEYGEAHNDGLYSFGRTSEAVGLEIGTTPTKDLLLYDRLVLSTANPGYMETYDKTRQNFAHSLELADYAENDTIYEKKANIVNNTVAGLASYCNIPMNGIISEGDYSGERDSQEWQICTDMVDEVKPFFEAALADVFSEESGSTGLDLLTPTQDLSNQSFVLLHMLQGIGHASSAFWLCSDHAEPNVGDLVEMGGKERLSWCEQFIDSNGEGTDSEGEDNEGDSTAGREGHEGFYESLTWKQKLNFWIDIVGSLAFLVVCIAAIVGIVGLIVGSGGSATIAIGALMLKLGHLAHGVAEIIHFLHSVFGIHVVHDDDHGGSSSGSSGSGDPGPPVNQSIGDVSINGANFVSYSHSQTGSGFIDCPYNYEAQITGSSSNLQQNLLSYSWNYATIPAMQPGLTGWVHQQDSVDTTARFFQQGDYIMILTVSHPHATDSPRTVTHVVNANHRCGDEIPLDTDFDVHDDNTWSQLVPGTPAVADEKWYDHGIRDLGLTMKHNEWISTRTCTDKDWNCYAGTILGIQHNNWLGSISESKDQLAIGLDVRSNGFMDNMDAIAVSADSSTALFSYREDRPYFEKLQEKMSQELKDKENFDKSMSYIVVKANLEIATTNGVPEEALSPLNTVLENWDEETVEEAIFSELKKAIEEDDMEDEIVTYLLHAQMGIAISSDSMGNDTFTRINWKKVGDIAGVVGGAALAASGNVIAGVGVAAAAGSSLVSRDDHGVGPGEHGGFTGENICAISQLESCMNGRLAEADYFVSERAAAANNVNQCGQDPSLTSIDSDVQRASYVAGEPVEWTLTVSCAILNSEYQIKTEVIRTSTGEVEYAEKTDWWVQVNTDYTHIINFQIDDGVDVGEYCVTSMLVESFSPVVVDTSSGTGLGYCFDVDATKSDSGDADDDKDDEGFLPGFSVLSALLSMLGAVIITLRRFEEK